MSTPPAISPARPSRRNVAFATVSAGSAGLLLLLQTIATHLLPVDDFGKFMYALRLGLVAEALMDLGLHQATVRAIARVRDEAADLLHNSLALKLLTAAAVFLGMSAFVLIANEATDVRVVCVAMLVAAVLRSYLLTIRGVYLGLERFGADAALVVGDRVLLLGVGAVALWYGGGLYGLAIAFVAARAVAVSGALAATTRTLGRLALRFDFARWRDLQQQALPIGMFLVLLNVYSYADSIMLVNLSTFEENALYNAAFILYEGLAYVPAVLSSVLTPRLSALWREDHVGHLRLARRGTALAAALAVGLALPMWLIATPLLTLLFGAEGGISYGDARTAFRLLLGGLPFIFVIWILQAVAISVFRERMLLRTTAAGVALNVALNFVLIPAWGRDGAALATLISEGASMLLLFAGLRSVLWPAAERTGSPAGDEGPDSSSEVAFGNLESNVRFLDRYGDCRPGARILEVGSGRGALLAHLRRQGCDVVGLDRRHQLLRDARRQHGPAPLVQGTGQQLPFPDRAFDVVLSFDVLEHLPDPDAHLAEVRRVLAPRGVYLLQTPNKWTNSVFETIRWKSFTRWREDHCSLHTYGQLQRRLERHGFAVEFADVPVVTPFFRGKVRHYLGVPGSVLLAVLQPDRWPRRLRTNFYARAAKQSRQAVD